MSDYSDMTIYADKIVEEPFYGVNCKVNYFECFAEKDLERYCDILKDKNYKLAWITKHDVILMDKTNRRDICVLKCRFKVDIKIVHKYYELPFYRDDNPFKRPLFFDI